MTLDPHRLRLLLVVVLATLGAVSCTDERTLQTCAADVPEAPAAPNRAVVYYGDVDVVIEQKCQRCHTDGGIAGPALDDPEVIAAFAPVIKDVVLSGQMPPFLAARCCNTYRDDFSLTDDEKALLAAWSDQGAPLGDPAAAGEPRPVIGGLSRIDVVIEMPEPFTVAPAPGRTDQFRCFVVDWPEQEITFVTGVNPVPLNRTVLHHLSIANVEGADLDAARAADDDDEGPGFDCDGGLGNLRVTRYVGGGSLGGDFPPGFGIKINPGSAMIFNAHYSIAHASGDRVDQLQVEMKVDDNARELGTIILTNPAWLLGDAMRIEQNDTNARYRVLVEPDLFTGDRPVDVWNINVHMHAYATRASVGILRSDSDDVDCLLEIPRWQFGWEQPYWLAAPVRLGKDDKLELTCTFDNGPDRQPVIDGVQQPSRDIAWGEGDQDMCAAFVAFATVEDENEEQP